MAGRPTRSSLEITGSNGAIYLDLFHGFAAIEPGAVSRIRKILRPFTTTGGRFWSASLNLCLRGLSRESAYPGLKRLISRFYESVLTGQAPPFSRAEILAVAMAREDILAAAALSSRSSASVSSF
jgi:predicted dehydrogenase